MITAFHGIGAYRGQRNPLALRNALSVCIDTDAQICVADRPIGAIGAVFFGEIAVVFDQDVWSYVENGKRYADDYIDSEFLANPKNQEGFENFCREHKKSERSYCEAWMRVDALRAVWVKEWADDATKKAAKILAKTRNVPLLIVCGKTRIWNILDNERLPFYTQKRG